MKRGQIVDESYNNPTKHRLLAQHSGKRSPLREKRAHLCGEVPEPRRFWLDRTLKATFEDWG
jgi:hypothetical protein